MLSNMPYSYRYIDAIMDGWSNGWMNGWMDEPYDFPSFDILKGFPLLTEHTSVRPAFRAL